MEKDYIGRIKETAEKGKSVYSQKLESILKEEIIKLKEVLRDCVKSHAKEEQFGLIVSNDSSSEIELYELVDRVKTPGSLEEKIIRNQEFFDLMDKEGNELIDAIKKNNDDLMGLRFLVSLSCDCKSLFDLLNKYQEELVQKNVVFLNLKQNPQIMRNGRPIYRIKGTYKAYPFELQIKSKVDSAWADIEHMLFYKDYQFSYIQSTNKQVMKKLGDLLDQVDELMIQVRESQASYEKDRKEMEFTQYLGTRFRDHIQKKIGSAFILSDYRRVLFSIFLHFDSMQQENILDHRDSIIASEFYSLNVGDRQNIFVRNYARLTENSLEFVVSEHIYVEWLNNLHLLETSHTVEALIKYFKYLITALLQEKMEYYLKENYINDEFINWGVEMISVSLENREMEFDFPLFLVNSEKMYMVYSFYAADKNAAVNMLSSDNLFDDGATSEIDESIRKINIEVFAFLFGCDVSEAAKNINDIMDECEELINYYSPNFIDKMIEVYSKVEKTVSGKAMPVNVLSKLFQEVMQLRQEV